MQQTYAAMKLFKLYIYLFIFFWEIEAYDKVCYCSNGTDQGQCYFS